MAVTPGDILHFFSVGRISFCGNITIFNPELLKQLIHTGTKLINAIFLAMAGFKSILFWSRIAVVGELGIILLILLPISDGRRFGEIKVRLIVIFEGTTTADGLAKGVVHFHR